MESFRHVGYNFSNDETVYFSDQSINQISQEASAQIIAVDFNLAAQVKVCLLYTSDAADE